MNNDEPVTVNGQTLPLGRELAAGLVGGPSESGAPDDPVATTTSTTAAGSPGTATTASTTTTTPGASDGTASEQDVNWVLTNGDDAASGLEDGTYDAVLTIPKTFSTRATSISGPAADAVAATVSVEMSPSAAVLDQALTQAVVNGAVTAFNETVTENYLSNIYEGFDQLGSSVGQITDGADQLASGTDSLDSGAGQLESGADQLASGLGALDSGARSLSDGVTELQQSVQELPAETQQLADGSGQIADVLDQASADARGATDSASDIVTTICADVDALCTDATDLLDQLEQVADDVAALASGSDQVADGNAELAEGMPGLVEGIDSSADGASQVADGTDSSLSGAESVADGAAQVAAGAAQTSAGAQQLDSGLEELLGQVPNFTSDDIATVSAVVTTPATADFPEPTEGSRLVPLIAALAMWVGAIALVLGNAAVAGSALLTSRSSLSMAAHAAGHLGIVGAVQGLAVAVAVLPFVDVGASIVVYLGVSVVVGLVFAVINTGLAALFGGVGRLFAAMLAALVLVVGITSTAPQGLQRVASLMPTTPAEELLRAGVGVGSGWVALVGLLLWGVIGFAFTVAGTARRRHGPALATSIPR